MGAVLLGLIVTTILGVLIGAIAKFWGEEIQKWLGDKLAELVLGAVLDRNMQADEEYRKTMTATIEALKERIDLLEKWRKEAQALEERVSELEAQIRDLRRQGLNKDDEIIQATIELNKAKRELSSKEDSIQSLQDDLLAEKNLVGQLQEQVTEYIAVQADNQLKIGALLHQIGAKDA